MNAPTDPDTTVLPRPGDPDFDYQAAFYTERDHRLQMLDRQRDLTAENDALWESVIRFNGHPLRELVGTWKATIANVRRERDDQTKVNRALIEVIREHGIEVPSDAKLKSLGDMLGRRDREVSTAQLGNKTLRRAAREARIELERTLDPDRLATQVARLDRRTPIDTVIGHILAPVEKALRILAAGEVAASEGKQAPRRALHHATKADVARARALTTEDDPAAAEDGQQT